MLELDTEILSGRNSEALTADVLIIVPISWLVTQIRTAVRTKQQTIEQWKEKYWLLTAQTPCDYESGLF